MRCFRHWRYRLHWFGDRSRTPSGRGNQVLGLARSDADCQVTYHRRRLGTSRIS